MRKYLGLLFITLLFVQTIFAQDKGPRGSMPAIGKITGKVIDKQSSHAIEYANVALYSVQDSSVVAGTVTDGNGIFKLEKCPAGRYYMYVKFIGYDQKVIENIAINKNQTTIDMGSIVLTPGSENIEGVEVVAERSQILYKLDKKIVNPGTIISAQGGSAVDVLENTPSVTVDVEGNVSLRGSGDFMVLIDGRPTPLDPSDALQQIPATAIENIEIITNPSAKYDPDGTSGIINVITKKNRLDGISGQLNLNTDSKGSYGGDILLNYRNSKLNAFVSANYKNGVMEGNSLFENQNIYNDTTYYTNTEGDRGGGRLSNGVKAGIDYTISSKDIISLTGNIGQMGFERTALNTYSEYTIPTSFELNSLSEDVDNRDRNYYSSNLNYQHKFNNEGHELQASINYQFDKSDDGSLNEKTDYDGNIILGQHSTEIGDGTDIRIKADYTYPINDKYKIEAGYQTRLENEESDYMYYEMDLASEEYVNLEQFNNNSIYVRNIHSLYGMFAGEYSKFSYQLGLRGEYTYRKIEQKGEDDPFTIDRLDFFPTIHTAYQLPSEQQIYLNYARRIQRPRNYYLEPFYTWSDAYNIRVGNPDLIPEYIDSYEIGYIKQFENAFVSVEGFFRQTNNKVERTRRVYEGNIMLNSFENVGTDYSTGVEMMYNGKVTKWWNINATASLYNYRVEGILYEQPFEENSTNYDGRLSNTFSLSKTTRIQLDGMYHGPSVTAQGKREGFAYTNFSFKQDLFKRKLSLTFQISDILQTAKHEMYVYGDGYSSYFVFNREAPIYRATLTWNFNNYRPDRKKGSDGEGMDGGMEDF